MANLDINKILDTADHTAECDGADVEKNKILSLLSYISLLFLIPMFCAKDSKFARFHVNQGIVLFICELIVGLVGWVLGLILGIIPFVGVVLGILLAVVTWVVELVFLALAILGIVNAVQGKAKELPLLGGIRVI